MKSVLKATGKALAWILGLVVAAAALAVALSFQRENRRFDLPFPALQSSRDSTAIARGRYLVHGPGHCADCHAAPDWKDRVAKGLEVPLSGGHYLDIYLGRINYPNITPDSATGIGTRSDGELARFFRRGIDHRGRIGLPFMMYADLSDSDLASILSYLRALPPISNAVPPIRYNVLGKVTRAYFLGPFAPTTDPPRAPAPGRTVEYGGYLVDAVANCATCHTARDMTTGEYTGPRMGGGMVFMRAGDESQVAVSTNLTPDPETGIMTAWTEEAFIRRFKAGALREWSPMPWGSFSRMTEDDLAAMFLYLKSLNPVRHPGMPAVKPPAG